MMPLDTTRLREALIAHGFASASIDPVATGKHNSTYVVRLLGSAPRGTGDRVILRVAPPDDAGFVFYERDMMSREPTIHAEVRTRTGIPLPGIYIYDDSRSIIDRPFLIMEFMPGTPLSDVQLGPEQLQRTMELLGRYLRALHDGCTGDRFGYPRGSEGPSSVSWPGAFFTMWNRLIGDIEDCGVYTSGQGAWARDALRDAARAFPELARASLLHMDVWSQNILVRPTGEITAILDWDRALWGDPEIEVAVLDYVDLNGDAFWQGYGKPAPAGEAAGLRALFYHLYEVQKYLVIWTLRGGAGRDRILQYRDYALQRLGIRAGG